MTYRILAFSDIHADKDTLGVPRYHEVAAAVWQVVQSALAQPTSVVIFLGDLCDPDDGSSTIRAQYLAVRTAMQLKNAGVRSIWVAGNHDVCEDGGGATTLTPLTALQEEDRLGSIFVAEKPWVYGLEDDLAVMCLPYAATSASYDPAEHAARLMAQVKPGVKVVVASHLQVPGIIAGEETTEMPRGRDMPFPLAETRGCAARLQGHYHRRQSYDPGDGGPPIHVVGSPARFTFGEDDHTPSYLEILIDEA